MLDMCCMTEKYAKKQDCDTSLKKESGREKERQK
jgi:hypothetical protein